MDSNTFKLFLTDLEIDGRTFKFFDVSKLHAEKYDRLPYSIRVLLESVVRNCDEFHVTSKDVKNILNWPDTQHNEVEIPFLPSRVLLQDFTGVPAIVDFAAMRDAVQSLGGDPSNINPKCPADLVIDHSIQVDVARRLIVTLPSTTSQNSTSKPTTTTSSTSSKPGRLIQPTQPTPTSVGRGGCCMSNESNRPASLTSSKNSQPSTSSPNNFLRQNFRNQADLLYQSIVSNNQKAASRNVSPSVNKNNTPLAQSINNNNINQQHSESNNRQTVIDAVYENCPFHDQRTECADALEKNQALEFERNQERFQFLKWGAKAFKNMKIVPPGSGIVHQVNLECLARVAFNENGLLYPDSLVGTDSHTTMINGLGIVGWGVGGIEAEAVMLGQPISMVLPEVVGYRIDGKLNDLCTSTDVVLTITKHLRQIGVVNKFVEFFGPGVAQLSIADRATIANMCPEYGATIGYFPPDAKAIQYLIQTGREASTVNYIEKYLKAVKLFRDYSDQTAQQPAFSQIFELDLATVQPCVSGPKRPQDKVFVSDLKKEFTACLNNKVGPNGFGLKEEATSKKVKFVYEDNIEYEIGHGSVVIAAITSCTNTSNPSVMLAAGLLAKKATDLGLRVRPYVKTSLSPGSGVVTEYLNKSGMLPCLEQLGFNVVGYGCMTCIGNSGPLHESIVETIEKNDLVAVGVLSGNRNFEGRIHPSTRANYLASPPLVVAYALAGRIDIDFENEPLGFSTVQNKQVYLRDVWPTRKELQELETNYVIPEMFSMVYEKLTLGNKQWNMLKAPETDLYPWDAQSTYIKRPPFFDGMTLNLNTIEPIVKSRVLLSLGDSITTDHISPAGSIARNSPAAKYLSEMGLAPRDFNSYGSRRGNDAVMSRGTFANIRLVNKLVDQVGPRTLYLPTNQVMDIFDAAENYKRIGVPVIIIAGKEYGSGSSRDWAAKGPWMLGVRAVIAESYERIHRSNLIGMGVIPFQFLPGQSSETLALSGRESFNIHIDQDLTVKKIVNVETDTGVKFQVLTRIDTNVELNYIRHGGVLNYMVRKFLK